MDRLLGKICAYIRTPDKDLLACRSLPRTAFRGGAAIKPSMSGTSQRAAFSGALRRPENLRLSFSDPATNPGRRFNE